MTLSEWLHWLCYGKAGMSLCGRAYYMKHVPFWSTWCSVVDIIAWPIQKNHCRKSFFWHVERQSADYDRKINIVKPEQGLTDSFQEYMEYSAEHVHDAKEVMRWL